MVKGNDIDRVIPKETDRRKSNCGWAIFFTVLVAGVLLYWPLPRANEYDTVIAARHFVDRDWIPGDWYLSQIVPYRIAFNFLAGSLVNFFGFIPALIIGRLLCIMLFAIAVAKLCTNLDIKWFVLFPFIAYFMRNQSLFAHEWMLAAFETKSFAYGFIILATAFAMKDRLIPCGIFAGLATSMHVLVGIYGSFCIAVAYLFLRRRQIPKPRPVKVIVSIVVYLIAGGFGIFAIMSALHRSSGELSRRAGEIYVRYRVAHHVLPSAWGNSLWPIYIGALLLATVALFVFIENKKARFLLGMTLASFIPFGLGIVIYLSGKIFLLKYYWFRFPDSFIPFSLAIISAFLVSRLIERMDLAGKLSRYGIIALACLALIYSGWKFAGTTGDVLDSRDGKFTRLEPELYSALDWISKNTARDAMFLVDPSIKEFYYIAERPMFVSLKHSPQTDSAIVEWFNRLMLITDGKKPPDGGIFAFEDWMAGKFYSMTDADLDRIRLKFDFDYYLDRNDWAPRGNEVYSNGDYRILESKNGDI